MRYWSAKLFFIRRKHQTSSHSKRLFLIFDFSPLVLYDLSRKNNNNVHACSGIAVHKANYLGVKFALKLFDLRWAISRKIYTTPCLLLEF